MTKRTITLVSLLLLFLTFLVLYVTAIRPWHMRWGATDAELLMALPGDSYIPPQTIVSTRAISIRARPEEIWPWILQLGQGRGGFYSYEWLENLFAADMHNAEQILPELQTLRIGDHISFQHNGPYTVVARIDEGSSLVVEGGWTWYVTPLDDSTSRLVVRYASFEVENLLASIFYYSVFEPAHFVMECGMMLGIKARAERVSEL